MFSARLCELTRHSERLRLPPILGNGGGKKPLLQHSEELWPHFAERDPNSDVGLRVGDDAVRFKEFSFRINLDFDLPKDAQIKIKIYSEGKFFESNGVIAYSQPNIGVGITFREVRPQLLTVLKQWLLAAAVAKYGRKT